MTKTFLSPLVCNAVMLGDSLSKLDIAMYKHQFVAQIQLCPLAGLKAAFSFKPMPAASRVPKKSPI